MRVAVLGGSGFIGSHVIGALRTHGHEALPITAPRLHCEASGVAEIRARANDMSDEVKRLAGKFRAADVVVNAAGMPVADSHDTAPLYGANALLPKLILDAVEVAGVRRLVHISSSGVQGRRLRLDESLETSPLNPYTRSKAFGEALVRDRSRVVIFRPTSVHGASRAVTRQLVRLMRSRFACVAGHGDLPSPQVLVQNVADAIAMVVEAPHPPPVVLQPNEGLTTASLARMLGGHEPIRIPLELARGIIGVVYAASRLPHVSPAVGRRLEMLWMGQDQDPGWLMKQGWHPVVGEEGWAALARDVGEERGR